MSIRVRKDGTMWCSAHTEEQEGDTYIDDNLHYEMSVEHAVLVALPMPEHLGHPQWWWTSSAPNDCDFQSVERVAAERVDGINYVAWRERTLLEDDTWFRRQYPAAVAAGDWEGVARLLSGRLRQMEKRAAAANRRADALEMKQND